MRIKDPLTYLELLVDALQALVRRMEVADLVGLHLQLLAKVDHLAQVRITLSSVLGLELGLKNVISILQARMYWQQTFKSAIDSARSALLVSSSWIVFSVEQSARVGSTKWWTNREAPRTQPQATRRAPRAPLACA